MTLLLSILPQSILPAQNLVAPSAVAQPPSLLIGAVSSLEAALQEVDFLFKAANTGIAVTYSFASSGALQQQIEQTKPIDVVISDANKQMNALQQKQLILPDTRQNLLTNRLVLIVPEGSEVGLSSFRQLTNPAVKRIAIGDPRNVAAGQYAKEVLENLGIWGRVQPKFILSSSVRNVLELVETGKADAGIVYETDAKASNKVKQVATAPKNSHSAIVYSVAVIRASRDQNAARSYTKFLGSNEAQTIFKNYGFGLIN